MTATLDRLDERLSTDDRPKAMWAWTVLRILIGWSFMWAFLDKMFGLGFATCRGVGPEGTPPSDIDFFCDAAMINGGSPTYGYLNFATEGSHTGFLFEWMAPSAPDSINLADIGFMVALLLLGLSLMLGLAVRIGAIGGALMFAFMFLAGDVWPENNPVTSSHIVEMVVLLGVATVGPGRFALQGWFERTFPSLSWLK